MKTAPHQEKYQPSPEREEKLRFCVAALDKILEIPGSPGLQEELFRAIVWIVSEIDGKFATRYRSREALAAPAGTVQHEHVVPMRQLWAIIRQKHMSPARLLPLVTACVVTREEHRRLTAHDRLPDAEFGWLRYAKCRIPVMDLLEQRELAAADLQKLNEPLEDAVHGIRRATAGEDHGQPGPNAGG